MHEEQDHWSGAWGTAQSFDDLCERMGRYLRGELSGCPGHDGPLDMESAPIVQTLLGANRLGFLTTCSQPGDGPALDDDGGVFAQRAFVCGFCTNEVAARFRALAVQSELIALLFAPNETGGCRIPVTLDGGRVFAMVGFDGADQIEAFERSAPHAAHVLEGCWYVTLVDPRWGRKDHLWAKLTWALARDIPADGSSENWPDWPLRWT